MIFGNNNGDKYNYFMMRGVFIVSDNIISPLGMDTAINFASVKEGNTGIRIQNRPAVSEEPFYASLFQGPASLLINSNGKLTFFENLLVASITGALEGSPVDITSDRTVLIISSTKGNISLLETAELTHQLEKRIALHTSARLVAQHFKCSTTPIVVSSACISGSLALLMGKRMIQSGEYDHAVVAGADIISRFILSGFQSFQAISAGACKPFDAERTGINLGEGAATVILSSNPAYSQGIMLRGGATSNDANHISGPSRTGAELCQAINKALEDADLKPSGIGYISAHGTATLYNDEMEANAITLAGLERVPVNSLKAYYGHTLGAAGIIESVIAIHSLKEKLVVASKGFTHIGVSKPINICTALKEQVFENCLKTASGFGGCNAALIFGKEHNIHHN